jgi:hypothetical protein
MAEEIKTSPDIVPDSNELDVPPVNEETTAGQAAVSAHSKKGDPWKTAFIVLAGITIISGTIYFTTYGKRNDLPTVPAADPAALPVQIANPATGQSEAAALSQQVPVDVGNSSITGIPGGIPGGDGYDPWANPGRYSQPGNTSTSSGPYQVYPSGPPGQNVYMETNPNSPFMSDGNTYVMVPANTAVNANRGGSNTNTNRAKPVTSPTPVTAPAANTGVPAQTKPPAGKPDAQPASNKPAQKPVKKTTGKPSGTDE